MAIAISRENYFWHKVHSITGIIPMGFYMVQHLTLNSFALAGPEYYNRVIGFFEAWPKHLLLALEVGVLWLPFIFHAVYGLFIIGRGTLAISPVYSKYREGRYYTLQRWTGIIAFLFLVYHVLSTSVQKMVAGNAKGIEFEAMQAHLTEFGCAFLILYLVGVFCASYHLSYGIWSFCIRWGITISEKSQARMWKFSGAMFVLLTLLGWGTLGAFALNRSSSPQPPVEQPEQQNPGGGVQASLR